EPGNCHKRTQRAQRLLPQTPSRTRLHRISARPGGRHEFHKFSRTQPKRREATESWPDRIIWRTRIAPSDGERTGVKSEDLPRRADYGCPLNEGHYYGMSPKSMLLRNGGDESVMPSFPGRCVRLARRFASARSRSTRC